MTSRKNKSWKESGKGRRASAAMLSSMIFAVLTGLALAGDSTDQLNATRALENHGYVLVNDRNPDGLVADVVSGAYARYGEDLLNAYKTDDVKNYARLICEAVLTSFGFDANEDNINDVIEAVLTSFGSDANEDSGEENRIGAVFERVVDAARNADDVIDYSDYIKAVVELHRIVVEDYLAEEIVGGAIEDAKEDFFYEKLLEKYGEEVDVIIDDERKSFHSPISEVEKGLILLRLGKYVPYAIDKLEKCVSYTTDDLRDSSDRDFNQYFLKLIKFLYTSLDGLGRIMYLELGYSLGDGETTCITEEEIAFWKEHEIDIKPALGLALAMRDSLQEIRAVESEGGDAEEQLQALSGLLEVYRGEAENFKYLREDVAEIGNNSLECFDSISNAIDSIGDMLQRLGSRKASVA